MPLNGDDSSPSCFTIGLCVQLVCLLFVYISDLSAKNLDFREALASLGVSSNKEKEANGNLVLSHDQIKVNASVCMSKGLS